MPVTLGSAFPEAGDFVVFLGSGLLEYFSIWVAKLAVVLTMDVIYVSFM